MTQGTRNQGSDGDLQQPVGARRRVCSDGVPLAPSGGGEASGRRESSRDGLQPRQDLSYSPTLNSDNFFPCRIFSYGGIVSSMTKYTCRGASFARSGGSRVICDSENLLEPGEPGSSFLGLAADSCCCIPGGEGRCRGAAQPGRVQRARPLRPLPAALPPAGPVPSLPPIHRLRDTRGRWALCSGLQDHSLKCGQQISFLGQGLH